MNESYPKYRTHYLPRTRNGWVSLIAFVVLFALCQPPVVGLANRIDPQLADLPFLYVWLGAVYVALIAVLIWALRRGV